MRLVELTRLDHASFYLNPDTVILIKSSHNNEGTDIMLLDGTSLGVKENLETVRNLLNGDGHE